jgi:hypothetical protein
MRAVRLNGSPTRRSRTVPIAGSDFEVDDLVLWRGYCIRKAGLVEGLGCELNRSSVKTGQQDEHGRQGFRCRRRRRGQSLSSGPG